MAPGTLKGPTTPLRKTLLQLLGTGRCSSLKPLVTPTTLTGMDPGLENAMAEKRTETTLEELPSDSKKSLRTTIPSMLGTGVLMEGAHPGTTWTISTFPRKCSSSEASICTTQKEPSKASSHEAMHPSSLSTSGRMSYVTGFLTFPQLSTTTAGLPCNITTQLNLRMERNSQSGINPQ